MKRYLIGAVAALALAGFVLFVGGRFYEISAIRQHPGWIYWGLATARRAAELAGGRYRAASRVRGGRRA